MLQRPQAPARTKLQHAFSVVYAARQGYVDYGAAVRIQAFWRGTHLRRLLLREVTESARAHSYYSSEQVEEQG